MKFLSVYEEACAFLNRSTERPDVSKYSEKKQKRLNADHDLETILEANNMIANDGKPWEADVADTSQEKWYPLFWVNPDKNEDAGFALSFDVCRYDCALATLGARHACINEEVAHFMGNNCQGIYKYTRG